MKIWGTGFKRAGKVCGTGFKRAGDGVWGLRDGIKLISGFIFICNNDREGERKGIHDNENKRDEE